MNNKVLFVKNISHEGPGMFSGFLDRQNVQYTVIDLNKNETLPLYYDYSAVVVLGGPDSANDDNYKIKNEIAYIRDTVNNNIPFLGICLGLQLLVKAFGGIVLKAKFKEIGFLDPEGNNFTVELTRTGKQDRLFKSMANSFNVFHLHGETVEITKDMELLATGKYCQNQIVKIGSNAYGVQSHFELTTKMFEEWFSKDPELLKLDKIRALKNFEAIQDDYINTCELLFTNFLKIAGILK